MGLDVVIFRNNPVFSQQCGVAFLIVFLKIASSLVFRHREIGYAGRNVLFTHTENSEASTLIGCLQRSPDTISLGGVLRWSRREVSYHRERCDFNVINYVRWLRPFYVSPES